jgi:hypothetical protein
VLSYKDEIDGRRLDELAENEIDVLVDNLSPVLITFIMISEEVYVLRLIISTLWEFYCKQYIFMLW